MKLFSAESDFVIAFFPSRPAPGVRDRVDTSSVSSEFGRGEKFGFVYKNLLSIWSVYFGWHIDVDGYLLFFETWKEIMTDSS